MLSFWDPKINLLLSMFPKFSNWAQLYSIRSLLRASSIVIFQPIHLVDFSFLACVCLCLSSGSPPSQGHGQLWHPLITVFYHSQRHPLGHSLPFCSIPKGSPLQTPLSSPVASALLAALRSLPAWHHQQHLLYKLQQHSGSASISISAALRAYNWRESSSVIQ